MALDDRDALLARIIADGDRRRQRRRAAVAGGLAAVVIVAGAVVAWPGGDDDGGERVAVAAPTEESSTTSVTPMATTTSMTIPTLPTDTTPTTAYTNPPIDDPSTTTTFAPGVPACRNSYLPQCGPFQWDYSIVPLDAPVEVTIRHQPEHIVAGQPVTFSVTAYDPDAPTFEGGCNLLDPGIVTVAYEDQNPVGGSWGGCTEAECIEESPRRYGVWDPPAATPGPPARTRRATATYAEPGRYTVTAHIESGALCDEWFWLGYHSTADVSITVDVAAA